MCRGTRGRARECRIRDLSIGDSNGPLGFLVVLFQRCILSEDEGHVAGGRCGKARTHPPRRQRWVTKITARAVEGAGTPSTPVGYRSSFSVGDSTAVGGSGDPSGLVAGAAVADSWGSSGA